MTEYEMKPSHIRSYEISIWTLQDRFISVLKLADIDVKGQVQNDKIRLVDDGTRELTFSIPKFYYLDDIKMDNPLWHSLDEMPLEANMHKLKVILNKNTEDEHVEEFLVTSVDTSHKGDAATIDIKAEGLAFHELGKIGYKIALAPETYYLDQEQWFDDGAQGEMPVNNINYWNDIVFGKNINRQLEKIKTGVTEEELDQIIEEFYKLELLIYKEEFIQENGIYRLDFSVPTISSLNINNYYKTNWTYEIQMDWSSFSYEFSRDSDKVYEEEYTSSWNVSDDKTELLPRSNVRLREKYRMVEIEESNIYNITQKIAEVFGVFCRYEYLYDDKYQIIGRKVVYYNNYLMDKQGHVDLTYPYHTSEIKRTIDNTDTITKMYVKSIDDNSNDSNILSIMDVEANRSMEDYLLNFDYLKAIDNLTDEQYEMIEPYEAQMRDYNLKLIRLSNYINAFNNQLIDLKAKYVTYNNAVDLDKDRIEEAKAFLDNLTNGTDVITIDNTNAKFKTLVKNEKEGWYYIEVPDGMGGLDPASVKLYKTLDWRDKENRLKDQVFSGKVEYDDYGNAVRIDKIYIDTDDTNGLYFTCNYIPATQYQNMLRVWSKRLEEDTRLRDELYGEYADDGTLIKRGKIDKIEWYLYGAKVGYGRVGSAAADGENLLAGVVYDSEDGGNDWNTIGHCRVAGVYNSEKYNAETGVYNEEFGDDVLDETPDLLWNYNQNLINKAKLFQKFERLMGPAMREGNWQPEDDYTNDGDYYYDTIYTYLQKKNNPYLNTSPHTKYLTFKWDERLFDEETPVIYGASIDTKMEQHLIVDLSDAPLELLSKHLDELDFIFYDEAVVKQIYEIENKKVTSIENGESITTVQGETEWTKHLKNTVMLRQFRLGSECELGWVMKYDNNEVVGPIPVLIVTGATTLTDEQIAYIMRQTPYEEGHYPLMRPFIGKLDTVISQITENGVTKTNTQQFVTHYYDNLKFISRYSGNIREEIEEEYKTYDTYPIRRVYPRLYIDSLKLKTDEKYLKININHHPLNMYEDFYVLEDERLSNLQDLETGFYVTIKPEALFKQGSQNIEIYIQYVLSNADISIYLDALEVMRENAFPKATYEVSLALLTYDFVRTDYNRLNQIVNINDYELKLDNVHGYISAVDMSLSKPWEDTIEVKNYETKFEDLFSTIVASSESMKKNENAITNTLKAFSSDGLLTQETLAKSMANVDLAYSFNQGTLTIDQANGIWADSKDGVVVFRGGGIFTSTQTDENGNRIWNTGILPSGINASLITTGQLDTNRIKVYAGDELRFQLNGDGLFAYKSRVSDYNKIIETVSDTNNQNGLLSKLNEPDEYNQFVIFNKEGLFLRSLNGAEYFNSEYQQYFSINSDVDRVEISWDGLILRNWNNDKVFWADPDTGNLNLTGNVKANSGSIGGWELTNDRLSGKGVHLISGPTKNDAGITLTNSEQLQDIIYDSNGEKYYTYSIIKNGAIDNSEKYYLKQSSRTDITIDLVNDDTKVYIQEEGIVSVIPKYQSRDTIYTGEEDDIDSDRQGDPDNTVEQPYVINIDYNNITVETVIYIAKDANNTTFAIDENNNKIIYDSNTNPNTANWYSIVKTQDPLHYTDYITEVTGIVYSEYVPLAGVSTLELHPYGQENITFSVSAENGFTTILNGKIGNFLIDSNALSGGTVAGSNLDQSNFFYIGGNTNDNNKKQYFGKVFYDIEANSEAGTFTLKRINGEEENFNIAAMAAYKRAVAAAATIQLTLSIQGSTVVATARSGGGIEITRTITVGSSGVSDEGGTGGTDSGCGECGNSCRGSCKVQCQYQCGDDCTKGCALACNKSCSGSCGDGCTSCTDYCSEQCNGTCTGSCTGGCANRCGDSCTTNCHGACVTTCTITCGNVCYAGAR